MVSLQQLIPTGNKVKAILKDCHTKIMNFWQQVDASNVHIIFIILKVRYMYLHKNEEEHQFVN